MEKSVNETKISKWIIFKDRLRNVWLRLVFKNDLLCVTVEIPDKLKENYDIYLEKYLVKNKGFVESLKEINGKKQPVFVRNFTFVIMDEGVVHIGTIQGQNQQCVKLTKVNNHLATIDKFIRYFDR